MKKILTYILLFIMTAQMLPQSIFERKEKVVVMQGNGLEAEDHIKEKSGKESKFSALSSVDFSSPVATASVAVLLPALLVLSPGKEIDTPPPNFC